MLTALHDPLEEGFFVNSALRSPKTDRFVSVSEMKHFCDGWLLDGQYRRLSENTTNTRRNLRSKFVWWLQDTGVEQCGADDIKRFLLYVATGHTDPIGRWGNGYLKRAGRIIL